MKERPNFNAVEELDLYYRGLRKWRFEMVKLTENQPPYDCDDDEALRRFDSILKSYDRKQELRILQKSMSGL